MEATGYLAVLLDMDGTLVDTERLIMVCGNEMLAAMGVAPLSEDEYGACIGLSEEEFWERTRAQRGLQPTAGELAAERVARVIEALERAGEGKGLEPLPGASELLHLLRDLDVPHAVASASPRAQVEASLRAAGLLEGLPHFLSGESDAPRNKPFPDVYEEAARRLGVDPGLCVAVEDSPTGAQAARDAGCYTLTVPSPGFGGPHPAEGHEHLPGLFAVRARLRELLGA